MAELVEMTVTVRITKIQNAGEHCHSEGVVMLSDGSTIAGSMDSESGSITSSVVTANSSPHDIDTAAAILEEALYHCSWRGNHTVTITV